MQNKIYSLDSLIDFGKHKGKTIKDVICKDVTYIEWAVTQVTSFELDNEAFSLYETMYNEYWYNRDGDYEDYSWHDAYDTYMYGKND